MSGFNVVRFTVKDGMDDKFISRPVNVDFSGGEKKRNEILQMAVLNPRFSVLDETVLWFGTS